MTAAKKSGPKIVRRKTAMNPAQVAAPIRGYYSNCVRVSPGPLLFISGQIAFDTRGKLVGKDDVAAQAQQVLRNIQGILEANGASMRDVVKVTVYVTDINDLDRIAPVRMKYFPTEGPASAIVEVSRLALPDVKVEIEAIAAVDGRGPAVRSRGESRRR
jgi:2-iminobutanoate/2-iminopropanoate deaminase